MGTNSPKDYRGGASSNQKHLSGNSRGQEFLSGEYSVDINKHFGHDTPTKSFCGSNHGGAFVEFLEQSHA